MIKTDSVIYHTETQGEYDWLMEKLEENGCIWVNGKNPTSVEMFYVYDVYTCISVKDKGIKCSSYNYYKSTTPYSTYEFIEVSEIKDKPIPEYAKKNIESLKELSLHSRKISQNINQITNNIEFYKDTKGKPKLSLVPPAIMFDVARIREYGNNKYPNGGPDNWKKVPIEDYRDAMLRHMFKYIENPEGLDEESGFPHYMHLACNIAFICQLEKEAKEK